MRRYLRYISAVLFLVMLAVFILPSCAPAEEDESEQLKFYSCDSYAPLLAIIEKYNNECAKNHKKSEQIEIVEFESEDEMNTRLSTEIMSRKGPDIISLDQKLPFEKLIDSNVFADLNELINNDKSDDKIDMNDYNDVVMNSGVYNDKRYFLPLFYAPDIAIVNKETLNKFKISQNFDFAFDSFGSELSYYLKNKKDEPFYWIGSGGRIFFNQFINSYVDCFNKKSYLDTDEFNNNLDIVTEIAKNDMAFDIQNQGVYYNGIDNYEGIFSVSYSDTISAISTQLCYNKIQGENPIILPNARKDKNTVSAYAQCAFAVNDNSKHKDKILNFIKYVLSEDVQKYWCNAEYTTFLAAIPVNKKAFASETEDAYKAVIYSEIYTDEIDDETVSKLLKESVDESLEAINNINSCSIYSYKTIGNNYYNSTVIGEIVDDYLNDKITKQKFLRQLKSATNIYLTE